MSEIQLHSCGRENAKINGRSMRAALAMTGASFNRQFGIKDWVTVCPVCDSYALGIETNTPWPFLCSDGVMRVATDFDHNELTAGGEELNFAGFKFSRAALDASVKLLEQEDTATSEVEGLGERFFKSPSVEAAYEFSRQVCEWGRGQRVWGNLERFHSKESLGQQICEWLISARTMSPEEAIAAGVNIKGLGVSFASKHLRLAMQDRFGVLDEVICEGLGFAMNEAGYRLFHLAIQDFQARFTPDLSVSKIESGVFLMVRQGVRAIARQGQAMGT